MNSVELEKEISRGKVLFTEILRSTSDFLERMPGLGSVEINVFEDQRQRLLTELIDFDASLKKNLSRGNGGLSPEMTRQLEEFRVFQEVFIQIIMDKNRAIVSLAGQELERIRAEFDAVGRGKQAISGYGKIRDLSDESVAKTA